MLAQAFEFISCNTEVENDNNTKITPSTTPTSENNTTFPNAVKELVSTYNYDAKEIILTWTAVDTDIDHYLVSCNVDGTVKFSDVEVINTSYTLADIGDGSGTYTFTVKAVNTSGNESSATITSITPAKAPFLKNVELNRNHIAYNDEDKTINVTVTGFSFHLISSQEDATVKVQITSSDGTSVYDTETATVDVSNNTAVATITAPTLSSATTKGTDFTVRVKLCGTIDSEHTETLNISDVATVTSISLSTNQISVNDVSDSSITTAAVIGTNLDVGGIITMQLYGSTGAIYGSAISVDTNDFSYKETGFIADIPVPATDDIYTVKVLFDGTAESTTASLQVYGVPKFSSFRIPKAGISKEDNTITATVIGRNFTAPNVTANSFNVSCDTNSITSSSVVTIKSDSKLAVTLTIPGTAGEYAITISNGTNSFEGTFTVKDYSDYEIGKIILADGSLVDSSLYTAIDTANPPVAVVAGFNDNGVVLGIGLHKSSSKSWAKNGSIGFNTNFYNIACSPSIYGWNYPGAADTATFTGDTDGSDNWEEICSVDPEGTADAATNYPAFNYANTYGTTYSDYLGGITDGWFMPSLAELCYVYRNFTTINTSFGIINDLDSRYADKSVNASCYWSSSQKTNDIDKAVNVSSDGYFNYYNWYKSSSYCVLVIHAF